MRSWGLVLVFASSCVSHDLVPCGESLCPLDSTCVQGRFCVSMEDKAQCDGKPVYSSCQLAGLPEGYCTEVGTCVVAICGNGVPEPSESCDDGNLVDGDACSRDCSSDLTCGNGTIDLVKDEECDDNTVGVSGDGCSSSCKKEFETWRDVTPRELGARYYARVVYDAARGEAVMFGGHDGTEPLGETWVFKNDAWEQRFPDASPEPR
jgi:cysteine-rich repeat protein